MVSIAKQMVGEKRGAFYISATSSLDRRLRNTLKRRWLKDYIRVCVSKGYYVFGGVSIMGSVRHKPSKQCATSGRWDVRRAPITGNRGHSLLAGQQQERQRDGREHHGHQQQDDHDPDQHALKVALSSVRRLDQRRGLPEERVLPGELDRGLGFLKACAGRNWPTRETRRRPLIIWILRTHVDAGSPPDAYV